MIRTIAIEREYGCGAGRISEKLASRLGWTLWDRKITAEIAGRLKCDERSVAEHEERLDTNFYRLMKIFMRGSYEVRYSGEGSGGMLDADSLSHMFEEMISDVAGRRPSVIVGRAAPWFLRDRGDTLRLFLYAPHEEKLRRLVAQGKSESEAQAELQHVDEDRGAFVRRYYNKTWPQRDIYHLMINTEVGDEAVIEVVLHEMQLLNQSVAKHPQAATR